jgi:hypothetical protein
VTVVVVVILNIDFRRCFLHPSWYKDNVTRQEKHTLLEADNMTFSSLGMQSHSSKNNTCCVVCDYSKPIIWLHRVFSKLMLNRMKCLNQTRTRVIVFTIMVRYKKTLTSNCMFWLCRDKQKSITAHTQLNDHQCLNGCETLMN